MGKKRKLAMKQAYLKKEICQKRAENIVRYHEWTHVTPEQIAKEIYGHAYVYYHWRWMTKLPLAYLLVYKHTEDGIDLEDKVDRCQMIWDWLWNRVE